MSDMDLISILTFWLQRGSGTACGVRQRDTETDEDKSQESPEISFLPPSTTGYFKYNTLQISIPT